MAKLKDCPFCGGDGKMEEYKTAGGKERFFCTCKRCRAETRHVPALALAAILWNARVEDGTSIVHDSIDAGME